MLNLIGETLQAEVLAVIGKSIVCFLSTAYIVSCHLMTDVTLIR